MHTHSTREELMAELLVLESASERDAKLQGFDRKPGLPSATVSVHVAAIVL